ncbi:MAG: YitT family protein [Clostridia bacterium]|nr:YitT family protein [Clostridia bacterium]MDD4145490.1 YitT family protein [Clostridia bacterium]MDD4666068.1 YitT family protein [Clostridia bacterium]
MNIFLPYWGIALGSFIFAFGLNYFIIANGLAEGGFTGLALIIHYLTGWSVGGILITLNIPLFFIGWKMWGKTFVFKTLLGVSATSLAIDLTSSFNFQTQDLLLGALYGGVLSGVGIGLVLRSGATTGGIDIIARLIHEKTGINMGKIYFSFDLAIISLVAFFFGLEKALYTLVALYIFSQIIDRLVEGGNEARAVIIISGVNQVIANAIINELERGATILKGSGAYTGKEKNILYVVISKHQLLHLKKIIQEVDPRAFIIVSSAYEVLGEGFRPPK